MKTPEILQRLIGRKPKNDLSTKENRMLAKVIKRQESITRKDIQNWKNARMQATAARMESLEYQLRLMEAQKEIEAMRSTKN